MFLFYKVACKLKFRMVFLYYTFSKKCNADNTVDDVEMSGNEMNIDSDSVDSELQRVLNPSDDSNSRPGSSQSFAQNFTPTTTPTTTPTATPKQQSMKRFFDKLKPDESDKIDAAMAEFFYGCNIPFRAADSIYFKNFMKTLRPAYNPPHRRLLAGQLLENEHEKMEKRNSELVKKMDKQVTLLVDGWENSSANQHYVVTMLATSNDQKVFLEAFNFSSIRETGVNLTDALRQSIHLAKERYDAEIYAVLSDNANNMLNMGAAAQLMNLLYSTCNSHTGNLLAGDIIKTPKWKNVLAKVTSVQLEFRKTSLSDRLIKAGGHRPQISCPTRWTSERDAAVSFIKNLAPMKTVTGKLFSFYIHYFFNELLIVFVLFCYSCLCC